MQTQPSPPKKKKRVKPKKLQVGWKPGAKKRKRNAAATMIQKCFRSYVLHKMFRAQRLDVRQSFEALKAFKRARDRNYWRSVDLRKLSREELRMLALSLNLPSTGKKVLLICRVQRWVDQHILTNNLAVDAAAVALDKQFKGQGAVYYCEAMRGKHPIDIQPLRGKNITNVAAGHESDAVYAIDRDKGSTWLCKTGGLSSQVGLCSSVYNADVFDPPLESRWLVNPVFVHTLRTEHVDDVQVARSHCIALARAGDLFSWGDNPHGQLGYPSANADAVARNRATVVSAIGSFQSVAVAVGSHHSVAICDQVTGQDGVIFCWGSNTYGQLGTPQTSAAANTAPKPATDKPSKLLVSAFPRACVVHRLDFFRAINIRKVACGALHTMAVADDGKLYSWGCNDGGRLGHPPPMTGSKTRKESSHDQISLPAQVRGRLSNLFVVDVACGAWHSACIASERAADRSGRVFVWGTGIYGQLGAGDELVVEQPRDVRLPPSDVLEEERATIVACGMHHTAALTAANNVYAWGTQRAFQPEPTKLVLADGGTFGRIASLACGRTFTIFNTTSRDAQSYEKGEVHRLWRTKEIIVPRLNLSVITPPPWTSSDPTIHPVQRLEPAVERKERLEVERKEAERIDAISIDAIVHPLCRICWRCDGFQPSPLRLWVCRQCYHEKHLHGTRKPGYHLEEYEAVRMIQCLYRARRARRVLQQAREKRYQRVYSIKHHAFFYYNLWTNRASWDRPPRVPEDVELPIRDPDEDPQVPVPFTREEAASIMQAYYRGHRVRCACWRQLDAMYEKHYDLDKQQVYYKLKVPTLKGSKTVTLSTIPKLLIRLYDLGEPYEIKRLKRYANWTVDDAARVVQRQFQCYQARKRLKIKLLSRYQKLMDTTTGQAYYYNTVTGESSWEKPKLLGKDEDIEDLRRPRKRRNARKEKFINEEAAARTIQAMFRRFQSRQHFQKLLARRYKKQLDEATGMPYYYDKVTGTSSWIKPLVLGNLELELEEPVVDVAGGASPRRSPRRASLLEMKKAAHVKTKAMRKREKRYLQRLRKILTPDEAARHIQRLWRTTKARCELRQLMTDAYVKILDPTTNDYYYVNKKTGHVSWERPAMLIGADVKEAHLVRRRRKYTITDPDEAITVLQGFCRRCNARKELLALLAARIHKVFDPESMRYYYFDAHTGQSAWKKPVTLKDGDLDPTW
ncbi:TPA: hypothetical protein N0F65_005853 [Lagenidium giganteum]|uniref:WW domain-containing protein n=1 Tax=Lagenidium giganteum TaxID=4803 RepID=A0AAV2YPQ9_9STRA|nr:TPA: hypothetical protein N0F65_005853 [Lagenidium giganteum]